MRRNISAFVTVPVGSIRANSAGVDILLEDSEVASAGNSIEVGVSRACRNWNIDVNALVVVHGEASEADAFDTVVVRVGWASWNGDALSSNELGSINTNAGF